MSHKYWNTKEFQRLKAQWDKKLADTGFEDIETSKGFIKNNVLWVKSIYNPQKQEYFQRCRQYLEHGYFENAQEEHIWSMHAEGESCRAIARAIRAGGTQISKSTVNNVIRKIEELMNELKFWENLEVFPPTICTKNKC